MSSTELAIRATGIWFFPTTSPSCSSYPSWATCDTDLWASPLRKLPSPSQPLLSPSHKMSFVWQLRRLNEQGDNLFLRKVLQINHALRSSWLFPVVSVLDFCLFCTDWPGLIIKTEGVSRGWRICLSWMTRRYPFDTYQKNCRRDIFDEIWDTKSTLSILVHEWYLICSEKQGRSLIVDVFVVGSARPVYPGLAVVTVEFLAFCLHSSPMRLQLLLLPLNCALRTPSIIDDCDCSPKFPDCLVIAELWILRYGRPNNCECLWFTQTLSYGSVTGTLPWGLLFTLTFALAFPFPFSFDDAGTLETLSNEAGRFIDLSP